MGPISPWCRIKDVIAALWPLGDLLSDGLATILYYNACSNETEKEEDEAHLCIYFVLSVIFMCLPSLVICVCMACCGISKKYIFIYGICYPVLAPLQRASILCKNCWNSRNCCLDGENDEESKAKSSQIALPEVLFESFPQVTKYHPFLIHTHIVNTVITTVLMNMTTYMKCLKLQLTDLRLFYIPPFLRISLGTS